MCILFKITLLFNFSIFSCRMYFCVSVGFFLDDVLALSLLQYRRRGLSCFTSCLAVVCSTCEPLLHRSAQLCLHRPSVGALFPFVVLRHKLDGCESTSSSSSSSSGGGLEIQVRHTTTSGLFLPSFAVCRRQSYVNAPLLRDFMPLNLNISKERLDRMD